MVPPGHSVRSDVSQGFLHDKNKCSRYCISGWVWMLKGNVMTFFTLFHRELFMARFLQSFLHLHKSIEVNTSLAASRYAAFSHSLHFSFSREMPTETALVQSNLGLICVFYYKYFWSSSEDDSKRDAGKKEQKKLFIENMCPWDSSGSSSSQRCDPVWKYRNEHLYFSCLVVMVVVTVPACLPACLLQKTASGMQLQVLGLILETAPWVISPIFLGFVFSHMIYLMSTSSCDLKTDHKE